MILASILALAAIIVIARLAFGLAVFALPVACGVGAVLLSLHMGAGLLTAGPIGLIAGTLALAAGQAAFACARSASTRLLVAILYAVPAGAIGFGLTFGVVAVGHPGPLAHVLLSLVGAAITAFVAFQRLNALAPPDTGRAGPREIRAEATFGSVRT